jgi:glycosyltransferase involved in cell wall biosynthesis
MVETGGWGGVGHYTWQLAEALAAHGADVHLVTSAQYELAGLARRFALHGVLGQERRYPGAAWRLLGELTAIAPDVVHVQSLLSTRFDALLWPVVRRRTPLVMTAHNVRTHERSGWESWTTWRCLAASDTVVVHTEDSADVARARLPGHRVALIHQGDYPFLEGRASCDRAEARRRLDLPPDARVLLAFGAIRPYKGLADVIAVMPELRRRHRDVVLVVVGPLLVGTEAEYRAAIAAAGVADAVVFRPRYAPLDEVPLYFRAADVAVYNYRDVTDSASLRLACAAGVPVVATAVGAFREFLTDGVNARLVPPGSRDALAAALQRMLDDPRGAAALATAARELSGGAWAWDASARATLDVYREVVARQVARGAVGAIALGTPEPVERPGR